MHSDPNTTLPLTMENLERQREEFGAALEQNGSATPQHFYINEPANTPANTNLPADFVVMGKFKTTVNEVLTCLGAQGNLYDIDDYIAVAEECVQAIKTLKLERRIESRRANTQRAAAANAAAAAAATATTTTAYPPPMSPSAGEDRHHRDRDRDEDPDQRSTTPAPTSYMAALLKRKKHSPARSPFKTDVASRDDVEAARHASALRSEERQRLAEERRLDRLQELRLKSEAAEAREQAVKARREEAEMRQRTEVEDRMENGRRRAEEARRQTVNKAHRVQARGEEVRLSNELRLQTKAMLLDNRMSDAEQNQEAKKEARQSRAQEKNEAIEAAAERRRNLSEERAERQKEREEQRVEKLRRIEEQRKQDHQHKYQKSEEWEKKVHRHQQEASAEAEARIEKSEEKMQQSTQKLEEQREARRQKQERQDLKLKEVKTRREVESEAAKPTLEEFMPPLSPQEEEQLSLRVAKLVAASTRQAKVFCDNYQKESQGSPKDLNRSKLRPAFSRLAAAMAIPAPVQCKQPLNDLLTSEPAPADHEFVRYYNNFEVIARVIAEARKARELAVVQQATDLLLLLFSDENEGRNNVAYFVRSGCTVPLGLCIRDEMKAARQNKTNDALRWMLGVIGACLECLSKDPAPAKSVAIRDQFFNELETLGIDRMCLAIVTMNCPNEGDLELIYCALCVVHIEIGMFSKRKGDPKQTWFDSVVAAFFSLMQNLLTPGGTPISSTATSAEPLSCGWVTILFCVFRTLNMLARWQLGPLQALLHDAGTKSTLQAPSAPGPAGVGAAVAVAVAAATVVAAAVVPPSPMIAAPAPAAGPIQITRQELFHVFNTFFLYIQEHSEDLETILPLPTAPSTGAAGAGKNTEGGRPLNMSMSAPSLTAAPPAHTFEDAMKYGLTLSSLPAYPHAAEAHDGVRPGGRVYPLRAALHECILLVGYLCLDDDALQEMLGWGQKKTLLGNMLNVLPAQYFSNAQHILFPTVLAAVSDNYRNMQVVTTEMEPRLLYNFVSAEFNGLSKGAKAYAMEHNKQLFQFRLDTDPKHAIRHSMAKVKGKNWADMEDDEAMFEVRTTHSTDTTSTTPTIEKEKLCKIFRTPGTAVIPFSGFYQIERRFPISYWPGVIEQLACVLDEK